MSNLNRLVVIILLLLISLGVAGRFIDLNWDQGHYLHPDERLYINTSIAWPKSLAEFFSTDSPLNPKMFYYGSLPLYLYTAFYRLNLRLNPTGTDLLTISRLVSALFSVLTIFLVYLLSKKILSKRWALLSAMLFSLSVGSIQAAHFNTTETILTFFIVFLTILSFQFFEIIKKSNGSQELIGQSLILGSVLGAAAASKITAFSFVLSPLSILLVCFNKLKWKVWLLIGLLFAASTAAFFFFGSPYNLIDFETFRKTQDYIQSVVVGTIKPPFTIIYEGTIPYIYQLTRIFPWIFSPLGTLAAVFGFFLLWVSFIKNRRPEYLVILLWPTVYFLVSGFWFNKFTRYYVPLLPFLAISSTFFFYWLSQKDKLKQISQLLFCSIILLQLIYVLSFVSQIYLKTNTRVAASEWIYQNIKPQSTIATEHWDDRLPLLLPDYDPSQFQFLELTVYDSDTPKKIEELVKKISQSDYIVLSSRRVFYSILQNEKAYPLTSSFYQNLFKKNLGFVLIHEERRSLRPLVFATDDDSADESFQSYDHPPVFIFQNKARLNAEALLKLIQTAN